MKLNITHHRPKSLAQLWSVVLVLFLALQILTIANTFALTHISGIDPEKYLLAPITGENELNAVTKNKVLLTCPANNNYTLSGSANNNPSGYIQLTPNANNQSGQAWSKKIITLSYDFSQKFSAYFGTNTGGGGGDGFAFVFRSEGTASVGLSGRGLGYGEIRPSVAVEFDTFQNFSTINDPAEDHTAYHVGGDYNQSGRIGNNVILGTITNGAWHNVEIRWNALSKTLRTYFDGVLVNTMVRDIVTLDLAGNPEVYYGFTASTGVAINEQAVCIQEITQTIPVSLTKAVAPAQIRDGEIAAYTWTFDNTAIGASTQSGIGFTDLLPAFITVVNPANIIFLGWAVNPTVTAVAGRVTVSGGTIANETTATIKVSITNIPGRTGSCPNLNFTNNAARISNLSNNVTNNIASPCLIVIACTTPATPVISVVTSPTCNAATGTFKINNYNAAYTYTISPAAGTSRNADIVTAPAGTYTVIASDNACSSAVSNAVTFTALNTPIAPIIAIVSIPTCSVATGTFKINNYNAAYTYTISPLAGTSRIDDIVTAPAGTYTVIATDNTCSSAVSNAITFTAVNNPATPVISVVTSPTCNAATGTFKINNYNAAYTYTISPAAGTSRNADIVTAPAGTYTVIASDNACSSAVSNAVTFTALNTPIAPIIAIVSIPTCSIATGTFKINNYNAAYTYTVSPAAGTSRNGDIVTAPAGTYTVIATDNTCSSAVSNAITFTAVNNPVTPVISIVSSPTCNAATGTFKINNYNAAYTYTINPATGTSRNADIVTAPAGTYTVIATDNACSSASSNAVTFTAVNNPVTPVISIVSSPTCSIATGTFKINNYNAAYTYTISPAAGTLQNADIVTAPAGSYTVIATDNTCSSAVSNAVLFLPVTNCCLPNSGTITVTPAPTGTCLTAGAPVNFTITGNNTATGYVTQYVLTDNSGSIIKTVTSGFTAPTLDGTYKIYAVNYSTLAPNTSPVFTAGTSITSVGGTCAATGIPVVFCVTGGCKLPLSSIEFAATGQNTNTGYTTLYALTDNNGIIISTHTASPIPAPSASGAFRIYAINYLTAKAPNVSPGASIIPIETSCSYFISNPISVCITTTPLPVKLASFTVTKETSVAQVRWTTTEEVDADYYSIERSSNAKSDWTAIGEQKAKGNSKVISAYSFTDIDPLKGTGYYRLKMVDVDGSVAYSRIRSLDFGDNTLQGVLYPNPVSTTLFLKDVNTEELKEVTIINYKGQVIYRSAALSASGSINVNHFPTGRYVLRLTDKTGRNLVRKFVVAH